MISLSSLRERFPLTPERVRLFRRIGIHLAVGFVVLTLTFYLSFPYDRISEVLAASAAQQNVDVEIGSAGPAFGVGVSFENVLISTRPTDGSKPTRIRIDGARVTASPLAFLIGRQSVSVSAETMGGDIEIEWRASRLDGQKSEGRLRIDARSLAMADLPGIQETINLPLAGMLGMTIDLKVPMIGTGLNVRPLWNEASGSVSWKCEACSIGDGKAKLKIAGNPLFAEGLSLPRLRLGDLAGKLAIEKGIGKFQAVQARSPDGELIVEGEMRLADPLPLSALDVYVRFRLSDALLKSADKLKLILQIAESVGKRSDGFYGFRLNGALARLGAPRWSQSSPFAGITAGSRPSNPTLGTRAIGGSPGQGGSPTFSPTYGEIPPGTVPPSPPQPPPPSDLPRPIGHAVDPVLDPFANVPRYPSEGPIPAPLPDPVPVPPVEATPPPSTPGETPPDPEGTSAPAPAEGTPSDPAPAPTEGTPSESEPASAE